MPRPEVFFKQVNYEVAAGHIRFINPKHLIINIVSMCVFPFIGKPMIRIILGMNLAKRCVWIAFQFSRFRYS